MNRNSLRSRPMPAAPAWAISGSSAGISMLACSSIASPSSVTAGRRRSRASFCRSRAKAVTLRRAAASVSGVGLTVTTPAAPSTTTVSPGRAFWLSPATPSTAGMPSARSMMAAWPSAPPSSVATPASRAGSSRAASAGRRLSQTSTAPYGTPAKLRNGVWVRLRTRRRAISRTSSARRSRPAGSSSAAGVARMAMVISSLASATAVSALTSNSPMRRRAPRTRREGPTICR